MPKRTRVLKLKQISSLMKERKLINIEDMGSRLKDIREVLGITQKQLAKKLKVKQPLIARLEKNSQYCSLLTLSKIAGALECRLMGAVVSKEPLERIIEKKAEAAAKKMLNRAFSHMALEKQSPNKDAYNFQLKKLTDELASDPGPELWED